MSMGANGKKCWTREELVTLEAQLQEVNARIVAQGGAINILEGNLIDIPGGRSLDAISNCVSRQGWHKKYPRAWQAFQRSRYMYSPEARYETRQTWRANEGGGLFFRGRRVATFTDPVVAKEVAGKLARYPELEWSAWLKDRFPEKSWKKAP